MDADRQAFVTDIDSRITRLTCDLILDPSPEAVAASVEELASALEAGGGADLAATVRELAGGDVQTLGAECGRLWNEWIAEDEVRRDVEALSADAE
jgi:hypothetical protein